ncbi:DNA helicase UvrD [Ursidibacter sp. B-7004-1]
MATSESLKKWVYHVVIGLDQFINAILGGAADETLSSRTYRGAVLSQKPKRKWQVMHRTIETLFFWEKGKHCQMAYESELSRKQYPSAFRQEE